MIVRGERRNPLQLPSPHPDPFAHPTSPTRSLASRIVPGFVTMSEDANPNVSAAKVARADDRSPSPPSASSPSSSLHRLLTLNPSMAAGAGAGLVSSVVTCPLDVVKTRLQAQTVGTNHHTYQGVLGSSSFPSVSIVKVRIKLDRTPTLPKDGFPVHQFLEITSGSTRFNGSLRSVPLSASAVALHHLLETRPNGMIPGADLFLLLYLLPATGRTILSQAGLRGFYRGLGPTVLGYLPTWAIYFSVYDAVKTKLGDDSRSQPGTSRSPHGPCLLSQTALLTAFSPSFA
jgi:hypothetical protein